MVAKASLVVLAVLALAIPSTGAAEPTRRVGVNSRGSSPTVQILAGTWRKIAAAPRSALLESVVWTGREMIIYGTDPLPAGGWRATTVAYRPGSNTWVRLANGPRSRVSLDSRDVAVWSGSRMLVVGHTNRSYTPATNTWRNIARPGFSLSGAVTGWTGRRFLAWGGNCCISLSRAGAAYNPVSNTWRALPNAPLAPRRNATGAWTGKELVVAGGYDDTRVFRSGAAYNLAKNTWRRLPPMPHAPTRGPALWDGKEVLFLSTNGARGTAYNPATNRWRLLPAMPLPRTAFAAVWTGHHVLVWGGLTGRFPNQKPPAHGEAYSPAGNRWSALPAAPLHGRAWPDAVWTGHAMIVWGGYIPREMTSTTFTDGARYVPQTRHAIDDATADMTTHSASQSAPTRCLSHNLTTSLGFANGTAGSVYIPLRFRNVSTRTCSLFGYPGVSAMRNGHQVGVAARWGAKARPRTVIVKPGSTVRATLQIVDTGALPPRTCRSVTAAALRVFPPGAYVPHFVTRRFPACSGRTNFMYVTPVQ
jgi:hypothetical protein